MRTPTAHPLGRGFAIARPAPPWLVEAIPLLIAGLLEHWIETTLRDRLNPYRLGDTLAWRIREIMGDDSEPHQEHR
jgi:hypothetical protein